MTVMEYYQLFIQKMLREASVIKFILGKTVINSIYINKDTCSQLGFFAELPERIGKVPVQSQR